jgi:hypothetical protein
MISELFGATQGAISSAGMRSKSSRLSFAQQRPAESLHRGTFREAPGEARGGERSLSNEIDQWMHFGAPAAAPAPGEGAE